MRDTEIQLGALTHRLSAPTSAEAVEAFFNELTAISGGIEMEIAASTYRFAAARAYGALVEERLARLHEAKFDGRQRVSSFMRTRLIPALRTCESMQLALADLANRTSRLLDLIRTRIDLQLAQQNVDLLTVINKRTHLQLRLQQTVEGLSVAAISYYVIALLSYVTEGAESAHLIKIDSGVMNAFLAPVVVVGMWFSVRRLRKKHQVD